MLIVKNTQISEVLKEIMKEESNYGSIENELVIIKVEKNEIRIGLLSKKSMSSYLSEKNDKPFGFIEFEGAIVVVFGEQANLFFEKNKKKKNISFLEVKPKLKIKEGDIPPPPVIYEPIVWIYDYDNGKLKLTNKGRFTLLI